MRNKRLLLVIILLTLLVLTPVLAIKAQIGSPRMILKENLEQGEIKTIERSISVKNPNNFTVNVSASVISRKGYFEEMVKILNPEFTLLSNETKNLDLIMTINKYGTHEGEIAVRFNSGSERAGLVSYIIITVFGGVPEEPPERESKNESREEEVILEDEIDQTKNNTNGSVQVSVGGDTLEKQTKSNKLSPALILFSVLIGIIVVLGLLYFFVIERRI